MAVHVCKICVRMGVKEGMREHAFSLVLSSQIYNFTVRVYSRYTVDTHYFVLYFFVGVSLFVHGGWWLINAVLVVNR